LRRGLLRKEDAILSRYEVNGDVKRHFIAKKALEETIKKLGVVLNRIGVNYWKTSYLSTAEKNGIEGSEMNTQSTVDGSEVR